jgi:hypothetical protein
MEPWVVATNVESAGADAAGVDEGDDGGLVVLLAGAAVRAVVVGCELACRVV